MCDIFLVVLNKNTMVLMTTLTPLITVGSSLTQKHHLCQSTTIALTTITLVPAVFPAAVPAVVPTAVPVVARPRPRLNTMTITTITITPTIVILDTEEAVDTV